MAADSTGWRVGTTEIGFDGVWTRPRQVVAVYHDGIVVKSYPTAGTILGNLFARFYVWRHR